MNAGTGCRKAHRLPPSAYVEAAANMLTNPQLDPYGKIPEFKFSAYRVEKVGERLAAE